MTKKGVPSCDEEIASGTGIEKAIATKEQSSTPSNPPSKTFIRGMIFLPRMVSWKKPQLEESRKLWQKCRDITVFSEKITERLIGTRCCWGYAAISEKKLLGVYRIHYGWIWYIGVATRRDFSIVWIRTVMSSTCVPSKVAQEKQWFILHFWTTCDFHLDGKSTSATSDVP